MSSDHPPGFPSSIGILPTDLFITIITMVIDTTLLAYAHEDVKKLRLVSRRWHEVIDSTPSFWTTSLYTSSSTWITQCLKRSKNSPLTIRWILDEQSGDANASALVPHATRWKILSLHVLDEDEEGSKEGALNRLLSLPLSDLEELYISGPGWDGRPLDQFGDHQPHLRRLYLSNFDIPWSSAILHSGTLQYLYIRSVTDFSPTTGEIAAIFLSNPNLVVAYIASRDGLNNSKYTSPSDTIATPMLKKLKLDMGPESLLLLLSSLPQQQHLWIALQIHIDDAKISPQLQSTFTLLTQHISLRLRALTGHINHVAARLGRFGVNIVTDTGCMEIGIRTKSSTSALWALKALLKAYPSGPSVALEWLGTFGVAGRKDRHSLLDFLDQDGEENQLTSISLFASAETTQEVLKLLLKGPPNRSRWSCQNLTDLRIQYDPIVVGDLLAFARLRCPISKCGLRVYVVLEESTVNKELEELEKAGIWLQREGVRERLARTQVFPFMPWDHRCYEQILQDRSHVDWLSNETEFL